MLFLGTIGRQGALLVVVEHAILGAFNVVVLSALDRPEEEQPAGGADAEHEEYQEVGAPHHGTLARREFPTTLKELNAMEPAATIGCSRPAIARGSTTRL